MFCGRHGRPLKTERKSGRQNDGEFRISDGSGLYRRHGGPVDVLGCGYYREEALNMDVCIVHTIERKERGWQVMKRTWCGFYHVFPGVLFTLDEARNECRERGFNVIAVGDIWQCAE